MGGLGAGLLFIVVIEIKTFQLHFLTINNFDFCRYPEMFFAQPPLRVEKPKGILVVMFSVNNLGEV